MTDLVAMTDITPAYRFAERADVTALEMLDRLCFAAESAGSERAAPDELSDGVLAQRVLVATPTDAPTTVIGFVQYHVESTSRMAYIAGLAVHPEHRRRGIGRQLLTEVRTAIDAERKADQVTMSVAPTNVAMLRIACDAGYVGTRYIEDYYGKDAPRILLSSSGLHMQLKSTDTMFVPAASVSVLASTLDGAAWQLAGVRDFPHGPMFELQRFSADERATMMANEASVSVSFAAVIVAALAVLAGFGFNEVTFPKPLIAHMIMAVIVTLIGLIVYANSTGKLSKLEFARVDRYMQMGNIITEFGGVYPMLQVLPVSVAALTRDTSVGVTTAVAASAATAAYHASEFGILRRYKVGGRNTPHLFDVLLCVSPVAGYVSWEFANSTGWWAIANSLVLCAAGAWCLPRIPSAASNAARSPS